MCFLIVLLLMPPKFRFSIYFGPVFAGSQSPQDFISLPGFLWQVWLGNMCSVRLSAIAEIKC